MKFKARSVGQVDLSKYDRVVLDHARLSGEDFSKRKIFQFCTIGSRLERCSFDRAVIEHGQFGAGMDVSEFVECNFDRTRIQMGNGGLSRFVRCSFRDADLRDWMCFSVELVDCTFGGARLRRAIFNGAVPENDRALLGRDRNEFHANDFSSTDLFDVAFRTGVDLERQRLPPGPPYLYLPDATTALARARTGVTGWQDHRLRQAALAVINPLQYEVNAGQRQLLLRADTYYSIAGIPREAVDALFALLRPDQSS